jgi:hypothetical protein
MEITVKKTIEEKVKLELPAYFKDSAHVYKISADETCIVVTTSYEYFSISKCATTLPLNTNAEPTTKAIYEQGYEKVLGELKLENLKK